MLIRTPRLRMRVEIDEGCACGLYLHNTECPPGTELRHTRWLCVTDLGKLFRRQIFPAYDYMVVIQEEEVADAVALTIISPDYQHIHILPSCTPYYIRDVVRDFFYKAGVQAGPVYYASLIQLERERNEEVITSVADA